MQIIPHAMGIDKHTVFTMFGASPKSHMESTEKLVGGGRKLRITRKHKLFIIASTIITVILIALAIGLGVGLTRDNDDSSDSSSDDLNSDGSNSTDIIEDPSFNISTMWQPAVGTTWQYVLSSPLNSSLPNGTAIWDIDLFDNTKATIAGLQTNNAKVICYFSAGSYEDWRPDANTFHANDLGSNLDGWPGEKWVNVSSPTLRSVMLKRLDLAKSKGCNGVDPDNVDGYDNDNGLGLTQAQAVDYVRWLASAAHVRGMSIGLKNAGAIISSVINYMQWSVNEQCEQYEECDTYSAFITAGKPVFHVEYPKGDVVNNNVNVTSSKFSKICNFPTAAHFSTLIKNMNLDLWKQSC